MTWMPKSFATILNSTTLTTAQQQALLSGAPFDAQGNSTAKVFYTVEELAEGLVVYTYQ